MNAKMTFFVVVWIFGGMVCHDAFGFPYLKSVRGKTVKQTFNNKIFFIKNKILIYIKRYIFWFFYIIILSSQIFVEDFKICVPSPI